MFFFKKKPLYCYKNLEKVRINIEEINKNQNETMVKVCENNNFNFYVYKPDGTYGNKYILGQNKLKAKQVFYYGSAYDLVAIFHNHLFLCNHGGELNRPSTFVKTVNIQTGEENSYNLRGDYSKFIVINGYGRYYVTDKYNSIKVENDELIISVEREKGTSNGKKKDFYNKNMNFEIVFKKINNKFVPYFKIENNMFELHNEQ